VRPNSRFSLALCLFFFLIATGSAQDSMSFMRLGTNIIQKKLAVQPAEAEQRAPTLRKLFASAGCGGRLFEQPVAKGAPNLICSTPGTDNSLIIVSASLDYTAKGDDEQIRWSDLAMLPLLAESLTAVVTRHSFVFVGFSGKNNGEEGAKSYIDRLTREQRANVAAVVALEGLGRTPPVYSVPGTGSGQEIHSGRGRRIGSTVPQFNPEVLPITRPVVTAAHRWNFDIPEKTTERGSLMTRPFDSAKIPVITFTSPAWTVLRYVGDHPIRDYRTKLDLPSYEQTYLFLSAYLLFLDRDLGRPAAPPPVQNVAQVVRDSQLEALKTTAETRQADLARALPPPEPPPAPVAAAAPPDTTPTFRTTARLVQVDVVATDKQGHPIKGLQREDFTVLQDGRPQNARVFEAHEPQPPEQAVEAAGAASAEAKPHFLTSYSNAPSSTTTQSWTIILLDMLNTPTEDQQVARNQLKKLADEVPEGQQVALFSLSSRLVMEQAFTTRHEDLLAAVKALKLQRSQILTTEADRQHEIGNANYIAQNLLTVNAPAQANLNTTAISVEQQNMVNRNLQSARDTESGRLLERVTFTLDAFAGLSRALSGYPGRKNVIWLSGNFPLAVDPDSKIDDKWRNSVDYIGQLSRTMALLSESRVAVYPVDIRGMQVRGIDISNSAAQLAGFTGGSQAPLPSGTADRASDLYASQTFSGASERQTMMEVAEQTGGRAFLNTNDFKAAMLRAIDDGSNYYTLAYAPDTKDDKPAYHRIEVKLNRPDTKLSYRRGYYSEPESGTPATGTAALQGALRPGMPPATMLLFHASVKPPDATHKTVQIDYVVNGSNVSLSDGANGARRILIDFLAVAFDKDGKEVAHAADTLDGTLPASAVEAQLRRGLPANQELALKPGVYTLRVGVQDRVSQRIGTVNIPLVVE